MKRPERQLYIPPALRSKFKKEYYQMDYPKDQYTSNATNRQAYSLRNNNSSQRSSSYTDRRSVLLSSSSSSPNPSISEESYKDIDSSDFEEFCNVPVEGNSDEEIKRILENNSDDNFNKTRRGKLTKKNHDIETENYLTNTEASNSILLKGEGYADAYRGNRLCSSDSSEAEHDRGLFFNDGDSSISDIEALIDTHKKKGKVLTSTPNSDIVEQKVLDAAKYVPDEEESEMESTLLGRNDVCEATANMDINKRDCKFEIYRDPSATKDEPKDYSEIFGNNYIPPPVPPPFPTLLPPIPRLPFFLCSPQRFPELRHVPALRMPQLSSQTRHPRPLLPPSLQVYPGQGPSAFMALAPRPASPRCVQSAQPRVSNVLLTPRPRPTPSPQRLTPPRSRQVTSNPQHLQPGSLNLRGAQSHDQGEPFYIPPPVPRPQYLSRSQQIRNLNRPESAQSRRNSLVNQTSDANI